MATQKLLYTFSSLSILSLLYFSETSVAAPRCSPSACGNITNIRHPFHLKGASKHCGDRSYELACEKGVASLSINAVKFYVKEINYNNSTIKLADASVNMDTCSFPTYSTYFSNFQFPYDHSPYGIPSSPSYPSLMPINLMSCPYPLKNSSLFSQNFTHCANSTQPTIRYSYIKVGHMNASELPERCGIDVIVMTSWRFMDLNNVSLSEIHHSLLYGFELTVDLSELPWWLSAWLIVVTHIMLILGLVCGFVCPPILTVIGFAAVSGLMFIFVGEIFSGFPSVDIQLIIVDIFSLQRFILFPVALWLLIYKFRRRHLSVYSTIESFLQSDNKLEPIRYSYSDIKRMTRGFKDKIGEGGYGSVYKGKLRSGRDVAVKVIKESRANSQDFVNEISTIGRIHHVNIVALVGYCAQGSKRVLVFDFMSNGSLEKYLFNREGMSSLNLDKRFEIAIGVARGIEYLHRGCDVQILHFDIKPHNVLLDDKFVPKVSDFGLAKFYSTDKNAVTMTAARGTIGYVAPELINRSIGAVSHKADVYSFGMLLMEMVSLKKNLAGTKDDSSLYFPYWIYDCFNQGKDIEIDGYNFDKDDSIRKVVRKMTIVALWCIQMSPNDRPPMNKVLEMLEGNVERLHVPHYQSQSTRTEVNVDQSGSTYSTDSVALLGCDSVSTYTDICIQD